jgi:hypothetical protein
MPFVFIPFGQFGLSGHGDFHSLPTLAFTHIRHKFAFTAERPGNHPNPPAAKLLEVTGLDDPKVLKIIVDAFQKNMHIIATKF